MEEDGSDEARRGAMSARLLAAAGLAYVEARGYLGRAKAAPARHEARLRLDRYWNQLSVVDIDEALLWNAGDLAERWALAGADAVHLAAALRLRAALSEPLLFACWDARLRSAALREGLRTLPA